MPDEQATVVAVHRSAVHEVAKQAQGTITLVAGHGVEGDAHAGATVQHRSRVRRDPTTPNRRQVHLIAVETLDRLGLEPGRIGENVTVAGVDLLALPTGTRLRLGDDAVVEVTGLRNPCWQLDTIRPDLREAFLRRDEAGDVVDRLAGVMGIVVEGGVVAPGDRLAVERPTGTPTPLAVV